MQDVSSHEEVRCSRTEQFRSLRQKTKQCTSETDRLAFTTVAFSRSLPSHLRICRAMP